METERDFLNLRNISYRLLELGLVPIVNEKRPQPPPRDHVRDNDILASMFAIGWQANLLILMSTIDGIVDEEGKVIRGI